MKVSRKSKNSKNMKKSSRSSKRSKNVRSIKKTRKHLRNMRGGTDGLESGVNQTVDFIIYNNQNEFLFKKNPNVSEKFALIGTFANSSLGTYGDVFPGTNIINKTYHTKENNQEKLEHDQTDAINKGITEYNEMTKTIQITKDFKNPLVRLLTNNAINLLKKKLKGVLDPQTINSINQNMLRDPFPTQFFDITNDIRLKETEGTFNTLPRSIKTQVFVVYIPNLTKENIICKQNDCILTNTYKSFFEDHINIINEVMHEVMPDFEEGHY